MISFLNSINHLQCDGKQRFLNLRIKPRQNRFATPKMYSTNYLSMIYSRDTYFKKEKMKTLERETVAFLSFEKMKKMNEETALFIAQQAISRSVQEACAHNEKISELLARAFEERRSWRRKTRSRKDCQNRNISFKLRTKKYLIDLVQKNIFRLKAHLAKSQEPRPTSPVRHGSAR